MNRIAYLLAVFAVFVEPQIGSAQFELQPPRSAAQVPANAGAVVPRDNSNFVKWLNGDVLPGELVSASNSHLKWSSKEFVDPFEVDLTKLDYIRFATPDMAKHGEPIRIVMGNGDVIYADLMGITDEHVDFTSKRHEQSRVRRSEVVSIQRLAHGSLIYLGPGGITGWSSLNSNFKIAHWTPVDEFLTTRIAGAELFREIDYADQVEVEIMLKWISKPGFLIALGAPEGNQIPKGVVGLETWDDTLVVHCEDDFEEVANLTGASKSLQIRLFLDYAKGECSVYSSEGKRLATLKTGANGKPQKRGFFVRNKGSDLSLAGVRVSKWAGSPPKEVREGINRVHLVDGDIKYGKIKSYSKSAGMVIADESGQDSTVTYEQFDSMYLPVEVKPLTKLPPARVSFIDGAVISGEVVGVDNGRVAVKTSYSDAPIWSQLASVRSIDLTHPEAVKDSLPPDVLVLSDVKLHGQLTGSSDPENPLAWLPVGSRNASAMKLNTTGQIIREKPEAGESPIDLGLRDILYLTNQDVVPCKIQSVDDEHLHIATPLVEITKIRNSDVKAVELAPGQAIESEGFGDPGWKVESFAGDGGVDHGPKEIVFHKPGRINHNTILFGDEASFDMQWNVASSCMITASPFVEDARRMPAAVANVNVQINQQTIWVTGGNGHFFGNVQAVNCPKGTAKVVFRISGKNLQVLVNEQLTHTMQFPGGRVPGNGISLSFSPTDGTNGRDRMLVLSNFAVNQTSGGLATPRISAEKKELILTVPRMRRESPPSHVLVARNGDMLRGRLTTLNQENVTFTSQLDDFNFARERLACIIWLHADQLKKDAADKSVDDKKIDVPVLPQNALLQPNIPAQVQIGNRARAIERNLGIGDVDSQPAADAVAANAPAKVPLVENGKPIVRVELSHGARLSFHPIAVKDGKLIGHSAVLGACEVPINAIRKMHMGAVSASVSMAYSDWILKAAQEPKLVTSTGQGAGGRSFGSDSPLLGQAIGNVTLTQLDGTVVRLDQLKGKVIILDFWATWCAPCVSSLPKVMDAVKQMDPKKVVFIAVNEGENEDVIKRFLDQREWKLSVGLDIEMKVGDKLGATALPHTLIIGPDGKIAVVHTGTHPKIGEELTNAVTRLLEGVADSPDAVVEPANVPPGSPDTKPTAIETPAQAIDKLPVGAAEPVIPNLQTPDKE